MSDFRYDPVFDQWVCIAETRQNRPVEFQQQSQRMPGLVCPFCPGNEHLTPDPIARRPASGPWLTRVFPNKYPALTSGNGSLSGLDTGNLKTGRQEVMVISPRHVVSLAELNDQELASSMELFHERVSDYVADPQLCHIALFMNCRPAAGASIEHAHFQLMGSPICTSQVNQRVQRMQQIEQGESIWRTEVRRELGDGRRVVDQRDDFVVFCPRASRYSGQLRFVPRNGEPFQSLEIAGITQLGKTLARWTGIVERELQGPAWNLVFFLPPNEQFEQPWFVDLIPRFPQFAGFELATDCWVNPLSPETIAGRYRERAAEPGR